MHRQAAKLGIKAIPFSQRQLGFFDTFVLLADLGISFLVMVIGMFLVQNQATLVGMIRCS
jgi:hypothetical protein